MSFCSTACLELIISISLFPHSSIRLLLMNSDNLYSFYSSDYASLDWICSSLIVSILIFVLTVTKMVNFPIISVCSRLTLISSLM